MSTRELGTPLQARQAFRLLINPPDFQTELCEGCEWCEVQKCPEIHSFFYPVCTFIMTEAIPSYNTMCQGAWGLVYLIITKCAPMTRAKKRCDINISPVDLKAALCRVQGVALHAVRLVCYIPPPCSSQMCLRYVYQYRSALITLTRKWWDIKTCLTSTPHFVKLRVLHFTRWVLGYSIPLHKPAQVFWRYVVSATAVA
jgi:hypothetical protein